MTSFECRLHADTGERMIFFEHWEKLKAWPVMTCKYQLLEISVLSMVAVSFRPFFAGTAILSPLIKILCTMFLELITKMPLRVDFSTSECWFLSYQSKDFFTNRPLVVVRCNVSIKLQPNLKDLSFRQLLAFLNFSLSGLILHSRSLKKVNIECPKPVQPP